MSPRTWIAAGLAALACACSPSAPAPRLAPLEPTAAARHDDAPASKVELARPQDSASGAQALVSANAASGSTAPVSSAATADDIFKQLGPIHVIGFDEAKSNADSRIDKTNAEAALEKLKADIKATGKGGG